MKKVISTVSALILFTTLNSFAANDNPAPAPAATGTSSSDATAIASGVLGVGALAGLGILIAHNSGSSDSSAPPIDYSKYQKLVQPLVAKMTLDEKIGQMTLIDYDVLNPATPRAHKAGAGVTLNYEVINQYKLGAILKNGNDVPKADGTVSGGGFDPQDLLGSTDANWRAINNDNIRDKYPVVLQNGGIKIPLLLGIDSVHGNNGVMGNVLPPHNIGLSMTHDPELLQQLGYWTAYDSVNAGFNWVYAPTVAVSHNPQWGRTYETFGSDYTKISDYARNEILGLQQANHNQITGVLATVKHYLGDGATYQGEDEGNDIVNNLDVFVNVNGQGYLGAMDAGVGSLMPSFSSVNGRPMSINTDLLQRLYSNSGFFANKTFAGFAVSDYGAVGKATDHLHTVTAGDSYKQKYQKALALAVNGGMDVIMVSEFADNPVPDNRNNVVDAVQKFQASLKEQIDSKDPAINIPASRIDEAVTKILAVKYAMGLIGQDDHGNWVSNVRPQFPAPAVAGQNPKDAAMQSALQAAKESLVLLKNNNSILPLAKNKIKYVVLVGESILDVRQNKGGTKTQLFANYDNIGVQNGGWTGIWQGVEGNEIWTGANKISARASSLLDGLQAIVPDATLVYPQYSSYTDLSTISTNRASFLAALGTNYPDMTAANTVIVGVLAEKPYAEFEGDVNVPACRSPAGKSFNGYCLYNNGKGPVGVADFSAYMPDQQATSLQINYDQDVLPANDGFDQKVIQAVRAHAAGIPLVTVLFSGRPVIVDQTNGPWEKSNAFVAAWLPGTTGGVAVASALFGDYRFRGGNANSGQYANANTLSMYWPSTTTNLDDYPKYQDTAGFVSFDKPLFSIGDGLAD